MTTRLRHLTIAAVLCAIVAPAAALATQTQADFHGGLVVSSSFTLGTYTKTKAKAKATLSQTTNNISVTTTGTYKLYTQVKVACSATKTKIFDGKAKSAQLDAGHPFTVLTAGVSGSCGSGHVIYKHHVSASVIVKGPGETEATSARAYFAHTAG